MAALDRNGLRPARWTLTPDTLIVASEAGVARQEERAALATGQLGPGDIIADIAASGGLAGWAPSGETGGFDELWAWLKGYAEGSARPEMFLAFGERDRLKPGHELLAAILPAQNVLRSDGGHGWREWRPLWNEILDLRFRTDRPHASGAD